MVGEAYHSSWVEIVGQPLLVLLNHTGPFCLRHSDCSLLHTLKLAGTQASGDPCLSLPCHCKTAGLTDVCATTSGPTEAPSGPISIFVRLISRWKVILRNLFSEGISEPFLCTL